MSNWRTLLQMLIGMWAIVLAAPVSAQSLPGTGEVEETAEAPAADPFERETPRSTVTGLLEALADGDYIRAARYFPRADDLPEVAPSVAQAADERLPGVPKGDLGRAARLAQKFQIALDRGGSLLPFPVLSNDSAGEIDDGLAENLERVGQLSEAPDAMPVLLERSVTEDGGTRWRIAAQTAAEIAQIVPPEAIVEAASDEAFVIAGAPLIDWLKLILLATLAFLAFRLLAALALAIMRRLIIEHDTSPAYRFLDAALPPLALYLAVLTFYATASDLEVSIIARQTLLRYAAVVAWIALAWFALRLVDAVSRVVTGRMVRAERRQAVTIISFLRRSAKVFLMAVATVAVLDTIGLDVTTGIAALGIGGLALALGAQKTIENLVGSVTLIADKPVQVGDPAKIGEIFGVIEDIGMRSTLVRTLDRTLVSIPNGYLASETIENYALRDRFLFQHTVGVTYDTDAGLMGRVLNELRSVLAADPNIIQEDARVRFLAFGESALEIEFFAYLRTFSFPESLAMQETLLLAIMQKLEAMGVNIAFPTRTVLLRRERSD